MLGHLEDLPRIAILSLKVLAVAIPLIIVTNLVWRLFSRGSLPPSLPWVGTGPHSGPLSRAQANLKSFFGLKTLLDEGYYKYSRNNQAYVLPYFLNGYQVVLPPSQIDWLLAQPDSALSQEDVNRQFLESDYTFPHPSFVKDPVHPEIIRHELTKKLNSFADDVVDEMEQALADGWGIDTDEWVEVNVYQTLLRMVARLSTRVFVGLPLCRDPEFLEACESFNRNVALSGAFLNLLPSFLKPFLAPLVSGADYLRYKKCARYILPTIKERLETLKNREKLPVFDPSHPSDYIQWAIDHAVHKGGLESRELESRVIATRFAILCFAAIQSSVITLTNAVFDIASSPDCASSLDTMRREVLDETATATTAAPSWSRAMMARLTHVDSALRESLRLNGFIERGIMKMVVAPGGVTLPDGSHVPRGTKVGISGWSVHHDDDIYTNATMYDAFRFANGSASGNGDGNGNGRNKPQALINTSDHFMGFSHGSHACPGRFFAANQMKIALGHIALRYEIEPIPDRPKNQWFFGHIAPPLGETLRVRRRKS
ncbi:cytochrome P450 [Apiospora rasikravindrae]|uniref:Cytochrome P450 n=1 Tax=Apiospora rasikravindrae TaxID=990691 RepID=A0ABR1U852_9PEZI